MNSRLQTAAVLCAMIAAGSSCTSEKTNQPAGDKPKPDQPGLKAVTYQTGEAGGSMENTFSTVVTVSAIDHATREITLATPEGKKVSFHVAPEVRNLGQIKVGDKVSV